MRYDPASYASAPPLVKTGGSAAHWQGSTRPPEDSTAQMHRQAAEFDDWEDEGGATASRVPESPCPPTGRHADELSG